MSNIEKGLKGEEEDRGEGEKRGKGERIKARGRGGWRKGKKD